MKTRQDIIEELQELEKEYSEQITSIRGAILILKGQIGVQPASISQTAITKTAVIKQPIKTKEPLPDKTCEYPVCGKKFTPKNPVQRYCDLTCAAHDNAEKRRAKQLEKDKQDHKFFISPPDETPNPMPSLVDEIKKNEQ